MCKVTKANQKSVWDRLNKPVYRTVSDGFFTWEEPVNPVERKVTTTKKPRVKTCTWYKLFTQGRKL